MSKQHSSQNTLSRRTVLRQGALVSTALGLGLAMAPSGVAAMNKAELIEAMASEAGLSPREVIRTVDAFTDATATALKKGQSATLIGFGSFSISKRSARTGRNPRSKGAVDDSPVSFECCPEFAAALDLNPGKGDEASAKCRDADVMIDAQYIARAAKLSKADAKRAIDGFISVTTEALKKGDRLSISYPDDRDDSDDPDDSFGSFSISKRSARTGRNPQTGKEIQSAAKNVVKFKAGAELSKSVN